MKKRTRLIILFLLIACLCTGAVVAKTIYPNISQKDLTQEDIVLKTKISEISDTKVDFRHNKQEILENKTYNLSFKEFNSKNSAIRQVVYTNDVGDEFKYSIETGVLTEANIDSNIVEKTSGSIDIDTAHKIMLEHFPENCAVEDYKQLSYVEREKGYFFWYKRYIGKYETMDGFSMTIGFDGAIITLHDTTNDIDWEELDIDEEYIDAKIQKYASENGITEITGDYVYLYQGKLCIECEYGDKYTSFTAIPLE